MYGTLSKTFVTELTTINHSVEALNIKNNKRAKTHYCMWMDAVYWMDIAMSDLYICVTCRDGSN